MSHSKQFDKVIANANKKLAEAYHEKAKYLLEYQMSWDSIECSNKAIELDPEKSAYFNIKGIQLASLGKYDEAILSFREMLKLDSKSGNAYNNIGHALLGLERYDEAIVYFDKTIELDPEDRYAYFNKAGLFKALGKCEEAIAWYDKIIALTPTNPLVSDASKPDNEDNVYMLKGLLLHDLGRDEEAISSYEKAISLDHRCKRAYVEKAKALNSLGDFKRAFSFATKRLRWTRTMELRTSTKPRRCRSWRDTMKLLHVMTNFFI